MDYTGKHIVNGFLEIMEGLSTSHKVEIIEKLSDAIKKEEKKKDKDLKKSFGAWKSSKSAEQIIKEIKESNRFREKDLKF